MASPKAKALVRFEVEVPVAAVITDSVSIGSIRADIARVARDIIAKALDGATVNNVAVLKVTVEADE